MGRDFARKLLFGNAAAVRRQDGAFDPWSVIKAIAAEPGDGARRQRDGINARLACMYACRL